MRIVPHIVGWKFFLTRWSAAAMVKTRSGKLSVPGKTVAGKPGALVLSVAETAVVLRMSTQAAYDAIARNQIPHVRIGGMIKVPWIRLERMLNGEK
jgi:hypothetical protein